MYGWGTRQTHNKAMKQYTKPKMSQTLFGLGFVETILPPQLGFLTGVFLMGNIAQLCWHV